MTETLHYEGPQYLFLRMMPILVSPLGFIGILNFYQKDLTEPLREIQTNVNLIVRLATPSDIEELITLIKRRYAHSRTLEWYSKLGIRDTILRRFQRGCKCFIGKVGEEIVHYNWVFLHWEETDPGIGRFTHLKNDEALLNDGFTPEEWRGKSIHTAVNNEMLRFLKETGYRRAYTIAGLQGKSAKKGVSRVGWTYTGTMLYFLPRGSEKARVWRIDGSMDPFVEEDIPKGSTE